MKNRIELLEGLAKEENIMYKLSNELAECEQRMRKLIEEVKIEATAN